MSAVSAVRGDRVRLPGSYVGPVKKRCALEDARLRMLCVDCSAELPTLDALRVHVLGAPNAPHAIARYCPTHRQWEPLQVVR